MLSVGSFTGIVSDRPHLCLLRLILPKSVRHLREIDSGVEDSQQRGSDEDHSAVEDEEAWFVLHDFVAPTAGHFSDSAGSLVDEQGKGGTRATNR